MRIQLLSSSAIKRIKSSVSSTRPSPARLPTPDCGLKRPCLRLLEWRPFGTRAGLMSIQMVGAVGIPLPPIVGNGMVGNIIINKGGEGRRSRPSPPKNFHLGHPLPFRRERSERRNLHPPRGTVAAGIGASTSEASKADSPTATGGSRAAQIIINQAITP